MRERTLSVNAASQPRGRSVRPKTRISTRNEVDGGEFALQAYYTCKQMSQVEYTIEAHETDDSAHKMNIASEY